MAFQADDMFGGAPPEEVVEEDVPVHVETTSSQQEHAFFNAAPVSSPSTPSIPVSTGSPMATNFSASPSFGSYNYAVQEEDTSAFKAWKAKHDAELDERHGKEQKLRQDACAAGKAELDRLLAEHKAKVDKNKATNRQHEATTVKDRDAALQKGDEWERVSGFMGAKIEREGLRDTSRYREIVLKMKHA